MRTAPVSAIRGPAGVVIAEPVGERRELSGGPYPATTNNRMEVTAAIQALRAINPGAAKSNTSI